MTESESKIILERDLNCLKQNKALPDSIEATEIAINALEKQIPKKPKCIDKETETFDCPCCGHTIIALDDMTIRNNCLMCGQKLDWSDK